MRRQPQLFFKITWSDSVDEFRRHSVNRVYKPHVPPPNLQQTTIQPQQPQQPQPLATSTGITATPVRKSKNKRLKQWIIGVLTALIVVVLGAFIWYRVELSPVNSSVTDKKVVKVESGSSPGDIAQLLASDGLIRNTRVFLWEARLKGVENTLQAGTYRLSPSDSTDSIIDHIAKGKIDTFTITFLPGATIKADRDMFLSAGYSAEEVDAALAKTYDSPLFVGKPASADLEGYIYGETYTFPTDTSVEAVLQHVFDQYYTVVQKNDLVAKYASHNLSLYQGITLASIVQREASPKGDDMTQIAEVFYNRLAAGMALGSDVTYQYIADKTGVARDPNLDSPYNTRRYTGLPPGPIATPGEKALTAGANPAVGDYLFFLNGDDGVTYFARTLDEHNANIKNHCQKKCSIL